MRLPFAWFFILVLLLIWSTPSFSHALAKTLSLALTGLTEDGGVDEDNSTTFSSNDISDRNSDISHEHRSIDVQSDNGTLPLHDGDDFNNYIRGSMNASVVTRLKRRFKTVTKKEKLKFLDRIALVSAAMLKSEHDAALIETDEDSSLTNGITPQSDFNLPGRHFSIVTTASLPWMTGTAVNPLLRAAYLSRRLKEINRNDTDINGHQQQRQWVTLVIPWLELEDDRIEVYGQNHGFSNPHDQELYIRKWLAESANLEDEADPNTGLKIIFYNARYHSGLASIFAMGDICQLIPDEESDICILEEPEHLNWYRAPGEGWTKKFNYVVGIVHTNYKEYASAHYSGLWTSPAIAALSSAMVRAYCHKVVKLSDVLQTFAPEKESTSNVHGVRSEFLEEGKRRGRDTLDITVQNDSFGENSTQVYFIGKILWAKGLDILLDLQKYYKQCTGEYFAIDVHGNGPELQEITRAFHGRKEFQAKQQKIILTKGSKKTNFEDKDEVVLDSSGSEQTKLSSPDKQTFEYLHSKAVEKVKKIKDNLDFEKIKDNLDFEKIKDNLDFEKIKDNLDFEKIKDNLDFEKIKDNLDFEKIKDNFDFDVPKSLHEYRKNPIPATFPGRVDHALLKQQYKVFVNPSISEVLCTTTAEALAMGKFVIIPKHPSNTFFMKFPNCLAYRNKFEFVANLRWALSHEPEPLTPELAFEFTWEAATERLVNATAISWRETREREKLGRSKLDERIAWLHYELGKGAKGDALRKVLGGGPVSEQFKYQNERDAQRSDLYALKRTDDDDDDDGNTDQSDDEEEGLPRKFRMSSLAKAIRSTATNGLPMLSG